MTRSNDTLLLGAACAALVIETILLVHGFHPFWSPTGAETLANVVSAERGVQTRRAGSLSWFPVSGGEPLYENDTVLTSNQSQALLELAHGGKLEVEPHSLLRLRRPKSSGGGMWEIQVPRGKVQIESAAEVLRLRYAGRDLKLSPGSKLAVVVQGQEENGEIQVQKGRVVVGDMRGEATLLGGERMDLRSGTVGATPLAVANVSPADSQILFQGPSAPAPGVRFSWDTPAQPEFLEISRDVAFTSPTRWSVDPGQARVELAPGHYWWRLTQGNSRSPVFQFSLHPYPAYRQIASVAFAKAGKEFTLRWEGVEDPLARYEIEVSGDPNFHSVQRRWLSDQPQTSYTAPQDGKIFWRVRAVTQGRAWPYSPAREIQVRKRLDAPEPRGAKELPKSKSQSVPRTRSKWGMLWSAWESPALAAETLRMEFSWDKSPEAVSYYIEVDDKPDFRHPLVSRPCTDTTLVLDLPAAEIYFWRVAGIDRDGDRGGFSPIQQIARARALPRADGTQAQKGEISGGAWMGYGASFQYLDARGPFSLVGSGLPLNRLVLGTILPSEWGSLRVDLALQPLFFSGETQILRQLRWTAHSTWFFKSGWGIGLRSRNEIMSGAGTSQLALQSAYFTSLLGERLLDFSPSWKTILGAELGIADGRWGFGLLWRHQWLLPFSVGGGDFAAEFLFHPHYRISGEVREIAIEAALSLLWSTGTVF